VILKLKIRTENNSTPPLCEINGSINIGRAMKAETDTISCIIRTLSVFLWNYEKNNNFVMMKKYQK
jgi:hypothetical protein